MIWYIIVLLFIDVPRAKTASIAAQIDNKYFVAQSFLKGTVTDLIKNKKFIYKKKTKKNNFCDKKKHE